MERNDCAWMPDRTAEIADDYAAWKEMQEDDDQIDPRDLDPAEPWFITSPKAD